MGLGRSLKKLGRKVEREGRRVTRQVGEFTLIGQAGRKIPGAAEIPGVSAFGKPEKKSKGGSSFDLPDLSIEPIRSRKPGLAATILTSGIGLTDDDDNIRRPLLLGGRGRMGRARS